MVQIFGYSEEEMVTNSPYELLSKATAMRARSFLKETENRLNGNFECEFVRKDGSTVYAMAAVSEIKDEKGQFSGSLVLIADITERKKIEDQLEMYSKGLEEQIKQRTKQLAEAQSQLVKSERFAAIGELAGMVGHDLRNPLTAIKNAAYYLRKKNSTAISDKSNEMLNVIDKSVEYSNKIVNDLLEFSREIKLQPEECSPKSLITYVLLSTKYASNIVILNHTEDSPAIWVDANKIERVFLNIIKNAIDAMPGGGTLEIRSRQNDENVEFTFLDTGIGIPYEIIGRIFTPLFTTKAQGMGFGLAICKRIVEAHQGKISVESTPNKGTTFTISLPIENPTRIEAPGNSKLEGISIIEDNIERSTPN